MALVRKRADSLGTGVPSRVLGNFSIAGGVTAVIGLPPGGVLAGAFGWRAIFAVNIPLAIISIALTLIGVAKDERMPREGLGRLLQALDLPGIVLFAGAITSLLVFLSDLVAPTWWLAAASVILAVALFFWERRTSRPLIDFRMLAVNSPLRRTYLRQVLSYLATYAVLYGASQWMEQSMGLNASTTGLLLIPMSLVSIILARVISARGWVRTPLLLNGAALILAAVVMLVSSHSSSVLLPIGMTLLLGFANGFSGFGNQATLYMQTTADQIAVASGLLRTATYMGAIFSSSLIGIAFGARATDGGYHTLGWVIGGIGGVVGLLTVLDRRIPRLAV
jgi:Arabinose efflux permease